VVELNIVQEVPELIEQLDPIVNPEGIVTYNNVLAGFKVPERENELVIVRVMFELESKAIFWS
jgi:hypothetical protein